jgi:hypothetical protein
MLLLTRQLRLKQPLPSYGLINRYYLSNKWVAGIMFFLIFGLAVTLVVVVFVPNIVHGSSNCPPPAGQSPLECIFHLPNLESQWSVLLACLLVLFSGFKLMWGVWQLLDLLREPFQAISVKSIFEGEQTRRLKEKKEEREQKGEHTEKQIAAAEIVPLPPPASPSWADGSKPSSPLSSPSSSFPAAGPPEVTDLLKQLYWEASLLEQREEEEAEARNSNSSNRCSAWLCSLRHRRAEGSSLLESFGTPEWVLSVSAPTPVPAGVSEREWLWPTSMLRAEECCAEAGQPRLLVRTWTGWLVASRGAVRLGLTLALAAVPTGAAWVGVLLWATMFAE